jgi:hypothetical protein
LSELHVKCVKKTKMWYKIYGMKFDTLEQANNVLSWLLE